MSRRLAAIMFTDVVGFAALAQRDETAAFQLLQEQGRLVLPLLQTHRGRLVNTAGDGLLVEFPNAVDAIDFGAALQVRLHERNARTGVEPLDLRVGVHLGEIQDVGNDIFGDAVNIAAHIRAFANPGGVCLSEPVYALVRRKVPYQLEKLGTRTVKDVQGPLVLYRVVLPWEHGQLSERPLLSRRLAAIMYTDVVGFTASAQANEADALARLREQEGLIRPLFEPYKGREIKSTGDGFLVEFESALGALECAVEIHRRMRERNSGTPRVPLELRIGLHVGDVEESAGDIFGDAVNVASRIVPLADPGGVCLSGQVLDHVQNKVAYRFDRLPAPELKGVRGRMDVYRVVMPWDERERDVTSPSGPRVAVLPFANISPDPKDEYFADGLTEELISTLSKVRDLEVISRTSVMQYKDHPRRVAEIARELCVTSVLEGSVRRAGDQVRIAVQLIDPGADKHLWSENYDRNLEDIFSIQSEIAQKIASALHVQLRGEERERIGKAPTGVTEAHLLYMKGHFHLQHLSKEELLTARWYFEQAIQKDPRYALAHAALAETYNYLVFFEMIPSKEGLSKAEAAARKAVELDPSLAEAHLALWRALRNSWNFTGALKEVRRALELNPALPWAHWGAANLYYLLRRFEEARTEAQKALELDPLSSETLNSAATILLNCGRPERAAELYEKVIEMDPTNAFALGALGFSCVRLGQYDEGIAKMRKAIEMDGRQPSRLADLAYALSEAGQTEEARRIASELVTHHREHGVGATFVAQAFASVGDREAAFDWLERAYREHSPSLAALAVAYAFETLQEDPRYARLLKKMRLPVERGADRGPDRRAPEVLHAETRTAPNDGKPRMPHAG